jgi:hypothetical protein
MKEDLWGHVTGMGKLRNYAVCWSESLRGRPRSTWEDDIKMDLKDAR